MVDFGKFILNSDLATLSQVGAPAQTSVTLPSSTSLTAGSLWTTSSDISIAGTGSFRSLISSSKISNIYYPTPKLFVTRSWSGVAIVTEVFVYRVNVDTIRVQASAWNPSAGTVTSPLGDEVFTVQVSNMVLPF